MLLTIGLPVIDLLFIQHTGIKKLLCIKNWECKDENNMVSGERPVIQVLDSSSCGQHTLIDCAGTTELDKEHTHVHTHTQEDTLKSIAGFVYAGGKAEARTS